MLGITKVLLQGNYTVYLEFNNGKSGIINLRNELENDHREIIRELLDLEMFNTVKLWHRTLSWDNGVDFAPEYLYEQISVQKNVA